MANILPQIIRLRLTPDELHAIMTTRTGDMLKVVVDLSRRLLALGLDLHADGEQALLDDGSRQEDLWGANVYPEKQRAAAIEYTSLINIRPRQDNRSMNIQDPTRREAVAAVLHELLPLA